MSNPNIPAELAYERGGGKERRVQGPAAHRHPEELPPRVDLQGGDTAAAYNLKPSLINDRFPPAVSKTFRDSKKGMSNDGVSAYGGTMVVMFPHL